MTDRATKFGIVTHEGCGFFGVSVTLRISTKGRSQSSQIFGIHTARSRAAKFGMGRGGFLWGRGEDSATLHKGWTSGSQIFYPLNARSHHLMEFENLATRNRSFLNERIVCDES